ncbi:MAG: type II toxin-antitoxin system VapC family toxin [Mesorhizobium sp.]
MQLVDSSAWIEVLLGSATGRTLLGRLPQKSEWIVPTLIQYEIHKWLARTVSTDRASEFISYSSGCVVVDLDSDIAVRASEVSRLYKLSTADAIIYATALQRDAKLLTCDAHFQNLPKVFYMPKQQA